MAALNNAEVYLDTRTAEQWGQVTRVIPKGFVCVELGESASKIKIGDGLQTYAQLPYIGGDMAEYYTKAEVDSAISTAVSAIELSEYYTKTEVDSMFAEIEDTIGDIQTVLAAIVEVSG